MTSPADDVIAWQPKDIYVRHRYLEIFSVKISARYESVRSLRATPGYQEVSPVQLQGGSACRSTAAKDRQRGPYLPQETVPVANIIENASSDYHVGLGSASAASLTTMSSRSSSTSTASRAGRSSSPSTATAPSAATRGQRASLPDSRQGLRRRQRPHYPGCLQPVRPDATTRG